MNALVTALLTESLSREPQAHRPLPAQPHGMVTAAAAERADIWAERH